jgi:hypothetical protein
MKIVNNLPLEKTVDDSLIQMVLKSGVKKSFMRKFIYAKQ